MPLSSALEGYRASERDIAQRNDEQLKSSMGQMGLLAQLQAQQQAQQVREIMGRSGGDPNVALPELTRLGTPAAQQAAQGLVALHEHQAKLAAAAATTRWRQSAPQFMEGGQPSIPDQVPATPVDDNGNPNPVVAGQPAVQPSMNVDKFLQAGMSTGAVNPETYMAHRASEGLKAATLAQTREATLGRLQQQDMANQIRYQNTMRLAKNDEERLIETARSHKENERIREALMAVVGAGKDTPHAITGVDASGNQTVNWARPSQGAQTFDSKPASVLNGDIQRSTKQEQFVGRQYNAAAKPSRDILGQVETYNALRKTGDTSQGAILAAETLQRAVRSGNSRFKADADAILGGGYRGGSLDERMGNFVSQLATGSPTGKTMADMDKLMAAVEGSAVTQIGNQARFFSGQLKGNQSIVNALGKPFVQGNWVVTPKGDARKFPTNEAAQIAAEKWLQENQ